MQNLFATNPNFGNVGVVGPFPTMNIPGVVMPGVMMPGFQQ